LEEAAVIRLSRFRCRSTITTHQNFLACFQRQAAGFLFAAVTRQTLAVQKRPDFLFKEDEVFAAEARRRGLLGQRRQRPNGDQEDDRN
jgi:hypothetical protein